MSEDPVISEADRLAFADGKLTEPRRSAVAAWLAAHPLDAAEVVAWQQQNEAIAALYGPVASERIPSRLDPRLLAARSGRTSAWNLPSMAAAAVVLLALGLGGGWLLRDVVIPGETPAAMLVDSAVTAHALYVKENRHAVEVAANDKQHLLTWLSNRIQSEIAAPDLTTEGFNLVGGRLLPSTPNTSAGPAAQLMYENAAAVRLTVYVTGALPDHKKSYEFVNVAGLDAFYWANADITCTVVGDLPEAQMKTVATKVYQQLTWRPDYVRGR